MNDTNKNTINIDEIIVAYFKPFNGTPWLDGVYAQNHVDVFNKLYTINYAINI